MKKIPSLLFTCFLILSACKTEEKTVTTAEAMVVKDIIDSCIQIKRPAEYNKLFSEKLLSENIAKKQNKKVDNSFEKGIVAGLNNAAIGQQIISSIGQYGSYEFVKQYEKDNRQHLIYRLYGDGSLNYHDYELGKFKGKVYISDMFIYISGEDFSETLVSLVGSISENDADNLDIKALRKMKLFLTQANYVEAKKVYDGLPTVLKDQRALQVMHLIICSGLDQEVYMSAINRFKELFPNEPRMYLMMIDASMLQKDYAAALEYINKTDSVINKDPFLDYYRGLLYRVMDDSENALSHFEAVSKNMPHFADGALALIEQNIKNGNFDKARELVTSYRNKKKFNQESLTLMLSNYPDFNE